MEKIVARTRALSQALYSLAAAGCEDVEVSCVAHAVKLEGIQGDASHLLLHVWSKEAEDTEADIGKGKKLTEDEVKLIDQGKCPKCPERSQLYKGPREGLAINVSCDAGHIFWVPPPPWVPEYRGQPTEVPEPVKLEEIAEEEEVLSRSAEKQGREK